MGGGFRHAPGLNACPRCRGTAQAAGFDRPILHGLATMGLVGRALIHLCCDGDPGLLTDMRVRFTVPVWPGETVRTEIWRTGDTVWFRASVPDRNSIVIDGGEARIGGFKEERDVLT